MAKLPMIQFGAFKTGRINTGFKRTSIIYDAHDHHAGFSKAKIDPATATLRIETAEEASKHLSGGRVGGGLIAGAILLGPLGAALGAGVGAAARKSYTDKYLIIEDENGAAYSVLLRNAADYHMAEKLSRRVDEIKAATA